MRKILSGLLLLFAVQPIAAQQSGFDFSIKNIMRGPELYGRQPDNIHWSADSKWIYFTWLEPGTDWRETPKQFRVRAIPGAKPERVSIQQADSTGYRFALSERSHNGRYSVVEFNGDIYVNDLTTRPTTGRFSSFATTTSTLSTSRRVSCARSRTLGRDPHPLIRRERRDNGAGSNSSSATSSRQFAIASAPTASRDWNGCSAIRWDSSQFICRAVSRWRTSRSRPPARRS